MESRSGLEQFTMHHDEAAIWLRLTRRTVIFTMTLESGQTKRVYLTVLFFGTDDWTSCRLGSRKRDWKGRPLSVDLDQAEVLRK